MDTLEGIKPLLELLDDPVLVLSSDRIIYMNAAAVSGFGDLTERDFSELLECGPQAGPVEDGAVTARFASREVLLRRVPCGEYELCLLTLRRPFLSGAYEEEQMPRLLDYLTEAMHSANSLGDLLDEILRLLPAQDTPQQDEAPAIHIAVVGRPNVGKSTLVNRLLGQERVMVSDIPGTTRDAVDVPFEQDGQRYNLIDTAGIRRRRAIEDASLERYSVVRSFAAIRRCDVAVILVDARQGVTEQDAKIAGFVHEEGRAAVIVVNKWDAVEKETGTLEAMRREVLAQLKFMDYAPVLFISALTGLRAQRVLEQVQAVYAQATRRITTGVLNDVLADAQLAQQPPLCGGRRLKIYYATQQSVQPPTFVLFVNDETLMHFAYERYLENQFRKAFGFAGTPIRFILRERKKED